MCFFFFFSFSIFNASFLSLQLKSFLLRTTLIALQGIPLYRRFFSPSPAFLKLFWILVSFIIFCFREDDLVLKFGSSVYELHEFEFPTLPPHLGYFSNKLSALFFLSSPGTLVMHRLFLLEVSHNYVGFHYFFFVPPTR